MLRCNPRGAGEDHPFGLPHTWYGVWGTIPRRTGLTVFKRRTKRREGGGGPRLGGREGAQREPPGGRRSPRLLYPPYSTLRILRSTYSRRRKGGSPPFVKKKKKYINTGGAALPTPGVLGSSDRESTKSKGSKKGYRKNGTELGNYS
jgi:hypothetical protein